MATPTTAPITTLSATGGPSNTTSLEVHKDKLSADALNLKDPYGMHRAHLLGPHFFLNGDTIHSGRKSWTIHDPQQHPPKSPRLL